MDFEWDVDKNEILKLERNISFERIVIEIDDGKVLEILQHPNSEKYPNQILIIVEIDDYTWVVPAVENKDSYFLKTAFPSRKYTKLFIEGTDDEI